MLPKFKRWLRSLSPVQAAIFYVWTAFTLYVVILHNPTGGYYGDWWNPLDWTSKNDLPAPDLLGDIDEFPNLLIAIGVATAVAAFGIWLTGIRAQQSDDRGLPSDDQSDGVASTPPPKPTDKLTPQSVPAANRRTLAGALKLGFFTIPVWWWVLFGINYLLYINMLWQDRSNRIRWASEGFPFGDRPADLERVALAFQHNWLAGAELLSYVIAGLVGVFVFTLVPSLFGFLTSGFRKRWRAFLGWSLTFFVCFTLALVTKAVLEKI